MNFSEISVNRGEDIFNFPKGNTQSTNKKLRSNFRKATDKILELFKGVKETDLQEFSKGWKKFCKDNYLKSSEIIATNTRTNSVELNKMAKVLTKYDK